MSPVIWPCKKDSHNLFWRPIHGGHSNFLREKQVDEFEVWRIPHFHFLAVRKLGLSYSHIGSFPRTVEGKQDAQGGKKESHFPSLILWAELSAQCRVVIKEWQLPSHKSESRGMKQNGISVGQLAVHDDDDDIKPLPPLAHRTVSEPPKNVRPPADRAAIIPHYVVACRIGLGWHG